MVTWPSLSVMNARLSTKIRNIFALVEEAMKKHFLIYPFIFQLLNKNLNYGNFPSNIEFELTAVRWIQLVFIGSQQHSRCNISQQNAGLVKKKLF